MKSQPKHTVTLIAIAMIWPALDCLAQGSEGQDNVSKAWAEHKKSQWESAIRVAKLSIDEFQADAQRIQQKLVDAKTPEPPVGKVSKEESEEIFNRGPLNDAGTCYFIIGESNEKLGYEATDSQKRASFFKEAKTAYEEASKLSYARTWDVRGWFWNPAQKAADKLAKLPPTS